MSATKRSPRQVEELTKKLYEEAFKRKDIISRDGSPYSKSRERVKTSE